MQSRVLAVLALLIALSFSFRTHAEVVKIAVLSTQDFHTSMKQWQSTAHYLSAKLPQHVFQVLPYSNVADLKTDLKKNKLDFVFTAKSELPEFVAEFSVMPVLNTQSKKQNQTWTLARNKQLPYQLTYSISAALLNLPAQHKAMQHLAINGWQLSGEANVVISSSQKLQQLYNSTTELAAALLKQYWSVLLAALMSGLLILIYHKWDRYHRQQQIKKHRQQSNDPSLSDTVF